MAILIKPVQKVNPSNTKEAMKWYVSQVTTAQVDETQVAMDLSDETTLNPSEAMMAIRQLRKIVLRRLLSGESVKLGNWGSFSVTISSTGSEKKEDVSAKNIKSVNLNFQPDEAFKTDLNKASFAWVDKLAEGKTSSSSSSSSSSSDSDGSSSSDGDGSSSSDSGDGSDSGSTSGDEELTL